MDIFIFLYLGHDLDLSRSRDVIKSRGIPQKLIDLQWCNDGVAAASRDGGPHW